MIRTTLHMTLLLAAALLSQWTHAEDIDIYAGARPVAARPNVLIVLDNSANWSSSLPTSAVADRCTYAGLGYGPRETPPDKEYGTKMGMEKCALYNLIDALPTDKHNIGLMLFNESPAAKSGGYPRRAILQFDAANKDELKRRILGLHISADKGNNAAFSKTLYEAFLYLTAGAPYRGRAGSEFDPLAFEADRYRLPAASGCSSHVIFIANGRPGEVTDNEAKMLLAAAGGDATQISYPSGTVSNSDQSNWADEFTRFMRDKHSIVTHTVAVTGSSSDGNYPNFIENMAAKGGGVFTTASRANELTAALADIFDRIQSASSVFAAASLPISVNARGTYLNQVFMGMFLPDPQARPRWFGNLKQYQFAYNPVTDSLKLVDSLGEDAINVEGGFVQPKAVSFWTESSTFWSNATALDPVSQTPESDRPDGAIVPKGGAAQRLREAQLTSQSGRRVFTCVGCTGATSLGADATRFAADNAGITSAALGVASAADRQLLIDWVRGSDNKGDENGPGGGVTARPSMHGDVLHSRPAVVNYGGDIGAVLFYGANDGMLHAISGVQSGDDAGEELWSFVPEEHFARLKRLRDNSPRVSFPNVVSPDGEVAPQPRDYFVDGPVSVYQKMAADGAVERVYIYVGMRRGGRFLYAFDVTDPAAPRYLWKKSQADIPTLGQTWSEPRAIKVRGHSNPVLIMGAGYDPAEDATPAGDASMGDAVVVLDAYTGAVVKLFDDPDHPVPADISVVDADYDGYVDRAYAVDVRGDVHRIDFEKATASGVSTAVADWSINTLATLGEGSRRKFFFAPDVVLTKSYAVILVGSGDREKPLAEATQDYFYTVIDSQQGKGVGDGFVTITPSELAPQSGYASSPDAKGCYVQLEPGEKVVNAPLTIGGVTYFGTNRPTPADPTSCSANLGEARSYRLPLMCKAPEYTVLEGGGLPPSPVGGIVEVTYTNPVTGEEETRHVPFIIGGENEKKSPIEASRVKIAVPPKRSKIYWHTEGER
jgi:type IV pilus assembly protein PilY1